MITLAELAARGILVCPRCRSSLQADAGSLTCPDRECAVSRHGFAEVAGVTALVDFEHSVLDRERLRVSQGGSVIERRTALGRLRRLIEGKNRVAPRQLRRMVDMLVRDFPKTKPTVLVIGGGVVGSGLAWLYDSDEVDLVAFDIYASPITQFIADGHQIPLAGGSVDGIIVQAVLEHVLRPEVVAAEIERVLRLGGMVYADTPFMQQVHEGAWDFTRFTDSGHRALFGSFERVDSGVVAGAGTSLRWSITYYVRALTRSRLAGRLLGLTFFWLSYTDQFLDPAHSLDGASSVFFLGRKTERRLSPAEIIEYYRGSG